jgi:hypothetical protein
MGWRKPKTKKEYYRLAMELWKEIATTISEEPGEKLKKETEIFKKYDIYTMYWNCPLCEFHTKNKVIDNCSGCCLNYNIPEETIIRSFYCTKTYWLFAKEETASDKIIYASEIYFKIKKAHDKL